MNIPVNSSFTIKVGCKDGHENTNHNHQSLILGIDPAKPFYEGKSFRLGAMDADFVDCVRLDIGGESRNE